MENEGGSIRWFVWWLLEPLCGVEVIPVLIIAFNREVKIKTTNNSVSHLLRNSKIAHSSSWMVQERPREELIIRSKQKRTLEKVL